MEVKAEGSSEYSHLAPFAPGPPSAPGPSRGANAFAAEAVEPVAAALVCVHEALPIDACSGLSLKIVP